MSTFILGSCSCIAISQLLDSVSIYIAGICLIAILKEYKGKNKPSFCYLIASIFVLDFPENLYYLEMHY